MTSPSDLIERLRDPVLVKAGMSLHREAADEIERLRAALKDSLKHVLLADAENERLQAWKDEHSRTEGGECPFCEIDRLRAALEGLLQDTQHRNHDCGDEDCPVKIAREALK